MNVIYFSEMPFRGKIPQSYDNLRTEIAWCYCWEGHHINLHEYQSNPSAFTKLVENADLAFVILPKKNFMQDIVNSIRNNGNNNCKISIMQEGPNWYWQDYPLNKQIWYYNQLMTADIIFAHNLDDMKYYRGLLADSVEVLTMRSIMVDDHIKDHVVQKEDKTMVGGNFVSWYGGFDSYMVAQEFDNEIYSPSMGRKQAGEEQLLHSLPYMTWVDWMKELSKYKYGVHLMRTHAAGTFAMNTGYWGIPCIGYYGLDTQELIHPRTTVELGDLEGARSLAKRLKEDQDFYKMCSETAKSKFEKYYTVDAWKTFMTKQLNQII